MAKENVVDTAAPATRESTGAILGKSRCNNRNKSSAISLPYRLGPKLDAVLRTSLLEKFQPGTPATVYASQAADVFAA
jgi:hypothetical protein